MVTASVASVGSANSGAALNAAAPTSQQVIAHLKMAKIPGEGAWFAVTYESADRIPAGGLPSRYGASRLAGTGIYALVTHMDFSAMHKLKTDEVWHFYGGDPIELLLLKSDGKSEVVIIGADILGGQKPQFTVHAGVWMGARPLTKGDAAYSLFGCTMAPGFDYADYTPGYRAELQAAYPEREKLIEELTRAEFLKAPLDLKASGLVDGSDTNTQPVVFAPEAMAAITIAPGVTLKELVGRVGYSKTTDYSVARFSLAARKGTGTSYCKVGEEFFLIISGKGTVVLGDEATQVAAGSVVRIEPGLKHSLTADSAETGLEFYAITFPAFSPDDYVLVK